MATILIVDDEANIRTHLATYVRSLGHEVEVAADGGDALAALARRRFDVVLSDVRMAQHGRPGAARPRSRGASPETVVVLMTAYATVPQAVEAMRAGAARLSGEALRARPGEPGARARARGAGPAAREPPPPPSRRRAAAPDVGEPGHAARARDRRACGRERRRRAADRRERHRQDRAGAADPRLESARRRRRS